MTTASRWARARTLVTLAGVVFAATSLGVACLDYAGEGFDAVCDDGLGLDAGSDAGSAGQPTCDAGVAPDPGSGSGAATPP